MTPDQEQMLLAAVIGALVAGLMFRPGRGTVLAGVIGLAIVAAAMFTLGVITPDNAATEWIRGAATTERTTP